VNALYPRRNECWLTQLQVLFIPVQLIWKVQIKWTQKAVLALSLCLTVIMIMITIIRISGIKSNGQIDQVWESYWLILSAEIGIILTAVTAFRAFFVSRHKRNVNRAIESPGDRTHWYYQNKHLLKRLLKPSLWRFKEGAQTSSERYEADEDGHFPMKNLPDIPRAHMTGVRTFIDGRGRGTDTSNIMRSQAIQEHDDTWPLYTQDQKSGIQVSHDISSQITEPALRPTPRLKKPA